MYNKRFQMGSSKHVLRPFFELRDEKELQRRKRICKMRKADAVFQFLTYFFIKTIIITVIGLEKSPRNVFSFFSSYIFLRMSILVVEETTR